MYLEDEYFNWLKNNTFADEIGANIRRISLPFLNQNNDYIEIYVSQIDSDIFLLSDDGETVNELEFSGFNFTERETEKVIVATSKKNNSEVVSAWFQPDISCNINQEVIKYVNPKL